MKAQHSESQARRAAKRVGMRAVKSRWRRDSIDNYGGFQILGPDGNPLDGYRYDLSADDVIEYCTRCEVADA